MPKQVYKLDQFHGGLNTNADPRDIADNELSAATDVMVDELGKIRSIGGAAAHASAARANVITAGYGLYAWNHDRVDGHEIDIGGNDSDTGENYLAFSDPNTDGLVSIYAFSDNTWGNPITGMGNNTGGTRKDVFYSVDGALRVCDSRFPNTNESRWYGYIDRQLFQSISDTVPIDQWYQAPQEIVAPDDTSEFDQTISASTLNNLDLYDSGDSDKNQDFEITSHALYNGGSGSDNSTRNMKGFLEVTVRITTVDYSVIPEASEFAITFTLTTGSANLDSDTFLGTAGTSHKITTKTETGDFAPTGTKDIVYTFDMGDHFYTSSDGQTFANSVTTYGIKTKLTGISFNSDYIVGIDIRKVRVQEANPTDVSVSGLTVGNLHLESYFEAPASGTAIGWNKIWEYGLSFIYDEKQESLVRRLYDGSASDVTEHNNAGNPTFCPNAKLFVAHGTATDFNRRITGAVWYIREASGGASANAWTAQIEYDFVRGVSKVLSTGKEVDCAYDAIAAQYEFLVDNDNLLSPNLTDTYTSRTGVRSDESSIKARFGAVCTVGRRMYIGNVKIKREDGTTEVKADAMLKSPVNKFDIFPSSSTIEAAINDGESIVALEEFADRILQFKENTLYVINVSQDIEFLEDVLKYKGVLHTAATCKTDYGIAWVNRLGCYLYDGRKVIDLLEKGGRQIIKESDWFSFTTDNSIIGYIPKKRQLIVLKDCTANTVLTGTIDPAASTTVPGSSTKFTTELSVGDSILVSGETRVVTAIASDTSLTVDVAFTDNANDSTPERVPIGDIFLYDMVTQSWVQGDSAITDSQIKSNFVNDVNGDLVWSHTSATGTMLKWADASATTTGISFKTKDLDFGHPAIRKKIYKAYVSYKGDGGAITVNYGTDGNTTMAGQFYITGSSGASTKANEADLCIVDASVGTNDWVLAELIPSSSINNIDSFRLSFDGGTTNADFEINDISVVYRMKNIK